MATAKPEIIIVASTKVAGHPIAESSSEHCTHGLNTPRRNIAAPSQNAVRKDPARTANPTWLVVFSIEARNTCRMTFGR